MGNMRVEVKLFWVKRNKQEKEEEEAERCRAFGRRHAQKK